ncbi:MAG: hypothetical protein LBI99_10515 [Propionibacteriaceae bacterium]|jgi:hypothetical protein|nr:hypothetical protein [Propionibacteriaceae bacterium]
MGLFSRKKNKAAAFGGSSGAPRADLVVPMLAGQAWVDANEQTFSQLPDFPAGQWPFAAPIADGLYVTYAIDPGPGWEVVKLDDVAAYGGAEALHAAALANLGGRGDIQIEGAGGRYILILPDERDLSISALLDPGRWRSAVEVGGDLVVAIPTRIGAYLCGAEDEDAIAELAQIAQEYFNDGDGKPVSPNLYRLTPAGLALLD